MRETLVIADNGVRWSVDSYLLQGFLPPHSCKESVMNPMELRLRYLVNTKKDLPFQLVQIWFNNIIFLEFVERRLVLLLQFFISHDFNVWKNVGEQKRSHNDTHASDCLFWLLSFSETILWHVTSVYSWISSWFHIKCCHDGLKFNNFFMYPDHIIGSDYIFQNIGANIIQVNKLDSDSYYFLAALVKWGTRQKQSCWWTSPKRAARAPVFMTEVTVGSIHSDWSLNHIYMVYFISLTKKVNHWRMI